MSLAAVFLSILVGSLVGLIGHGRRRPARGGVAGPHRAAVKPLWMTVGVGVFGALAGALLASIVTGHGVLVPLVTSAAISGVLVMGVVGGDDHSRA